MTASCLCGAFSLAIETKPEFINDCNCSLAIFPKRRPVRAPYLVQRSRAFPACLGKKMVDDIRAMLERSTAALFRREMV